MLALHVLALHVLALYVLADHRGDADMQLWGSFSSGLYFPAWYLPIAVIATPLLHHKTKKCRSQSLRGACSIISVLSTVVCAAATTTLALLVCN